MNATRIYLSDDPFGPEKIGKHWAEAHKWPARWICHPSLPPTPFAAAYRMSIDLAESMVVQAHVTADERYELFIDGKRVAMGSERGDVRNWFYETYEFELTAGAHTIVALVPSLGEQNAYAQITLHHGFLFVPQNPEHRALLATGEANWESKLVSGLAWNETAAAWGTGSNLTIDGTHYPWGIEQGLGDGWETAVAGETAVDGKRFNEAINQHFLFPATLPPMLDERRHTGTVRLVTEIRTLKTSDIPVRAADNLADEVLTWQRLISGEGSITIPPHTRRRVIVDLNDYYCARPEIVTSEGTGSAIRVHWQEALYDRCGTEDHAGRPWSKGNRDEIEGKYFACFDTDKDGDGDLFLTDGGTGRVYSPFWWQAGRYVEICVETTEAPLVIEEFCIRETRYPLEMESRFTSDDPRLERITPIMLRALQMCAHETYMDCPFYEQLMYVGDTRLEVLTTFTTTSDDRLPQKAACLFDVSRQLNGLTQSRYPSKVRQIIPPFSLWYVCMLHDRAIWKHTPEFDSTLLLGARGVMEYFLSCRDADGLIKAPEGWNYVDWVPQWKDGEAPGAKAGVNASINWQTVLALRKMAELEAWHGEPELAARWERHAMQLQSAIQASLWNEERALYAEDPTHLHFSQHAQCLAVLSGALDAKSAQNLMSTMLASTDLYQPTIMFRFYLLEALHRTNRTGAFWDQLPLWFQLPEWGFKTTWEEDDPNTSRSDCHAWGAHPLYHYFASILGIRPASRGFETVHIKPLLGNLGHAEGVLPHPQGAISVEYRRLDGILKADISLPANVTGIFEWNGKSHQLRAGAQSLELKTG